MSGTEDHIDESTPFESGTWDTPGRCICGEPLPPQSEWERAGMDWQNTKCGACGMTYVDEEDYIGAYEPDPTEPAEHTP